MNIKTNIQKTTALAVTCSVLLCVAGCDKSVQSEKTQTKEDFFVTLLFVNDGVKVYRFYDCGRYRYYTDARGAVAWSEQSGKITTPIEIPTAK